MANDIQGLIFDVDTFAVHDGPGIRMAVYVKGCPLSCAWCHSPESQRRGPELVFARDRCVLCGACVAACPRRVHAMLEARHTLARDQCVTCGACAGRCPTGALSIKGEWTSAARLVERAARLKPFFDHSGGGVTLTGGEVTWQADFAAAILAGCRTAGIHTAIETCGACSWERLARLLPHTDLVLYDLKLADDAEHRRWTGASNSPIIANLRQLAMGDVQLQIRVPLIPGITDAESNLCAIFMLMQDVGLKRVALLPCNPSAGAKYEWLDRSYAIEGQPQNQEVLDRSVGLAREYGIEAMLD